MENGIEAEIINILERECGIALPKLSHSSRLLQDLGIDGDDAVEFFQIIQRRFGTDFRLLNNQWLLYFNQEGLDPRTTITWVALLMPSGVATAFVSSYLNLPKVVYGPIGILMFFGFAWSIHRLLPKRHLLPITIGRLSEVVERGAWPDRVTEVS